MRFLVANTLARRTLFGLSLICLWLSPEGSRAAEAPTPPPSLQAVEAALKQGDFPKAIALAGKILAADPRDFRAMLLRARAHEESRDYAKAVADYDAVLKLNTNAALAYQRRGEAQFRLGHFKESIADFDKFIELMPAQAPQHWQRGIALYYAGRYEDGRKQFELHQTVNSHDVENSVWHFLCVARARSRFFCLPSRLPRG